MFTGFPPRLGPALVLLAMMTAAAPSAWPAAAPENAAHVVERILAAERGFQHTMHRFQPRIETYIQALRPDRDRGTVPAGDDYFLGTLDLTRGFHEPLFTGKNFGKLAHAFFPAGFAGMISPDWKHFDRQHYVFQYEGMQFLGTVRCLIFNVSPRPGTADGSFLGRIWAEDQTDTIVRFDGTYVPNPKHQYVHFDSWRMNLGPGLWLPVAIYSQERDQPEGWFGRHHIAFKAQTRFWGYQLSIRHPPTPLTQIEIDPAPVNPGPVMAPRPPLRAPLARQREWELKAENDVLARMQQAGLLAPTGPVDQVLATVAHNLEIANHVGFDPPVRCRVLLTSPLESFTVGHTIVVSRGLIDVLPDEASLAMILAHELGHIALDQSINSDYAFDDEMMFPDTELFSRLRMARSPAEEAAANAKGMELLEHSPYKDQLAQAGLFLEALQRAAPGLPNLITPHLGNPLVVAGRVARMQALLDRAPHLQIRNLRQIAALPLGARIQLNPWNDSLQLLDATSPEMLSPRDKLSFEITPYLPYLTRTPKSPQFAETAPAN